MCTLAFAHIGLHKEMFEMICLSVQCTVRNILQRAPVCLHVLFCPRGLAQAMVCSTSLPFPLPACSFALFQVSEFIRLERTHYEGQASLEAVTKERDKGEKGGMGCQRQLLLGGGALDHEAHNTSPASGDQWRPSMQGMQAWRTRM